MGVKLDFSNVGEGGFSPMPAGTYPATIFNIEQKLGRESRQPYLEFTFKVKDSNRQQWSNYSLQPQAIWKLKQLLMTLGVPESELAGEMDWEPSTVYGKEVHLVLRETVYNGQPSNEVVDVLSSEQAGAVAKPSW